MKRRTILSVSDLKKYKCKNRSSIKRVHDKQKQQLKQQLKQMIQQWCKAMVCAVPSAVTALKKTKISTTTTHIVGAFGISEIDADALIEEMVHNSLGDLK